jgi:hypothetical protein
MTLDYLQHGYIDLLCSDFIRRLASCAPIPLRFLVRIRPIRHQHISHFRVAMLASFV